MKEARIRFFSSLKFPSIIVGMLWIVHIAKLITGDRLSWLGVYPREMAGFKGVFTAPFIHSDWSHLASNSVPFFVLTFMIFYFYRKVAYKSFFLIYFLTGLAVWLFGRSVFHIGASGVVYGLVSFVFWSGIFRRNVQSIILALIVTLLYSGMFLGLVPTEGISWESHLFGAIVGIIVSYIYKDYRETEQETPTYSYLEEEETDEGYFLPRDIFDKTRQDRVQDRWQEKQNSWYSDSTWKKP